MNKKPDARRLNTGPLGKRCLRCKKVMSEARTKADSPICALCDDNDPQTRPERVCFTCEKPIPASSSRTVYCSAECFKAGRDFRPKKTAG